MVEGGIDDGFVAYIHPWGGFTVFLVFTLILIAFAGYLFAINEMIKVARLKGFYKKSAASLWVIAIFCPLLIGTLAIGFIVMSLPDRGDSTSSEPELPAV